MKVFVKRKHIERGIPKKADCCPIALALKEKTHNKAFVCHGSTTIERKGECVDFKNSIGADNFINNFDNGRAVKPCWVEFFPEEN